MSVVQPSTPRRDASRASHLRQVSNGSSDTQYTNRPATSTSSTGTIQHDPSPAKLPVERRCFLWVHEESSSKDDILLNLDLFPDVKPGELMAIVPLKTDSGVRDFQEQAQRIDVNDIGLSAPREMTNSNPGLPGVGSSGDLKHDVDLGKRYLFIVKDMARELKAKHPKLEISVLKNIADVFCLKNRSNVLLTVSLQLPPTTEPALTKCCRLLPPLPLRLISKLISKMSTFQGLTCGGWL